jgi:ADP-heptose:LPS heptosyltransferase/lauroyl/myristoyl acyltransferase
MLAFLLSAAGWLIARTPEALLQGLTAGLGEALRWVAPGRHRLMLSNLHHAFPERSPAWRRQVARQSSRQLVETGLLSIATPHLSERRIRRIARLDPTFATWAGEVATRSRPVVFATLHLALWECQTWVKLLSPVPLPPFGIIFRPLDHPGLDAYVKASRERFGMALLSRKHGFAEAVRLLRANGCAAVLFDQNAGDHGDLTLFFDRVCSTTGLPGLLAARLGAELRVVYPRRTGFWRASIETHRIASDGSATGMTLALNRWLEETLAADAGLCASWLWAHNRWRNQDVPARRLRLESRRNLLADDLKARGRDALPRRTRVWVRLPNWLGDVVMTLPLLRALRLSRPDAEITLFVRASLVPLLAGCAIADRIESLPARGPGYFAAFRRRRHLYPDVWIAFTNSVRGDLEGWLTGAPQRFGLVRPGRPRPLLTHGYPVPAGFDEAGRHQTELWEAFLRAFGLHAPITHAPLRHPGWSGPAGAADRIGLIAGSENNPEKRWPAAGWRQVIASLPDQRFVLFGTAADRPVTAAIAAGFPAERVRDLAGRTDLDQYVRELLGCRLVVANDTGGMHLANALGLPLVALFGPTNPRRTGPIFAAPRILLQPPDCPPTGGGELADLPAAEVLASVRTLLPAAPDSRPVGQPGSVPSARS